MEEQALIALQRELHQKAEALKKLMAKAYVEHNVVSRVCIDGGLGKPISVVDVIEPDKLGDDLDMNQATATERMAMVYDINVSAMVMYSDLSPTEARTIAQLQQAQYDRRGVFAGLSESVES